jgi:gelsolin
MLQNAMLSKDPQLQNIGKQQGLMIWRINKFELEPVPHEQYGSFYAGDSYVVLYVRRLKRESS